MHGRPVLLNPYYWPEVRRGSERFIHDLGRGLADRGLEPTLIASGPLRAGVSARVEDGIEVLRAPRLPQGRRGRRLAGEPVAHSSATVVGLARRRRRAGILHAFHVVDAWWALRARARCPVVFSVMGVPDLTAIGAHRRRRRLWAEVIAGADAVLALSEVAASAIAELGVEPAVIHPGVDLDAFTPQGGRRRQPTLLCPAARDDPRKRVGLLVEAWRLLRRERPELELLLSAGPGDGGPGQERLEAGVTALDLDRHGDLLDAYRGAWVTALPSRAEAFGLVLVESLACGTPVVGSADGGAAEIIDSERVGALFEGEDPAALAEAVGRGLRLAETDGGAAACRERAADFSVAALVDAHLELYARLTGS